MIPNTLYFGDNLEVLREHFPDECVDLVYLDPPFNSKRDYNYIYRDLAGAGDTAQEQAFSDTWTMEGAAADFAAVTESGLPEGKLIDTLREIQGNTSLVAYLAVMARRLRELHRVLKPTGSLYLHCDPTASHYLKMVLDCVFCSGLFLNELVWKRTGAHGSARRYGPVHDVVLFYAKGDGYEWTDPRAPVDEDYVRRKFTFTEPDTSRKFQPISLTGPGARTGESGQAWRGYNPTATGRHWALPAAVLQRHGIEAATTQEKLDSLDAAGLIYWPAKPGGWPRLKSYADELDGGSLPDVVNDIAAVNSQAAERLGYPTQKPLALLERIIAASSNPGDLVLDPFCGCGTAVVAAQKLGRLWCGIDITSLAVNLIRERLADHWPDVWAAPGDVPVTGLPRDVHGARDLFEANAYDYQFWALTLVGAHPPGGTRKKGADRGIDGEILWRDGQAKLQRGIVSVKGGKHVSDAMLKDLIATVDAEKAAVGLFVTLTPPTRPMRDRAALAGDYQMAGTTARYPRIQLLTIEELLAGRKPDLPKSSRLDAHREAPRVRDEAQQTLDLGGEDE